MRGFGVLGFRGFAFRGFALRGFGVLKKLMVLDLGVSGLGFRWY